MLPGVKTVPGDDVAVWPLASGNAIVTEFGPKLNRPARFIWSATETGLPPV